MKFIKGCLILFLFTIPLVGLSQLVSSSCTAPDSIIKRYTEDAHRLVLKNREWTQTIAIDPARVKQVLNALLAVYNTKSIKQRDTVVSINRISTFQDPLLDEISFSASSQLDWMQKLKANTLPSGNSTLDDLIKTYSFSISYSGSPTLLYHNVTLYSNQFYNMDLIALQLRSISDISDVYTTNLFGDGNDILMMTLNDHIDLAYKLGKVDCMVGCGEKTYWLFSVFNDCSVKYQGRSQTIPLQFITAVEDVVVDQGIMVYPNPVHDKIQLHGVNGSYHYQMKAITGQLVQEGHQSNEFIQIDPLITSGLYFLTVHSDQHVVTIKLQKE